MPKSQTYRFEYLRREGDVFFLGLRGPRGGIHSFSLAKEDVGRLLDAYFRARGAPPQEEREASRQAAEETMRQAVKAASGDDSIPIEVVIAAYKGISLEEATAWWEQKVAEAPARRAAMLRTLPYRDRHQVIRLDREAAVLVPMARYRSWSSRSGRGHGGAGGNG
jgi:hypothetical protein